ncbi:hypothetical protein N7462_008458 [Penicillium macrosclerotiorum]|uniref:uncharacterized protein n=1 Tax=Penicillium macrosclerotiorum TaxID=303699 RepID=UPI00254812C0|nr:uncharacterized protein N7462_008458 [Penicillium macrosclerotiorum]KAJ5675561.1 hypothetical protein N7462_008458 [Penicillium macrosclerotiorum]
MPNQRRDIHTIDRETYPYIFEKDVTVPLKDGQVIRCNIYRPKDTETGSRYPVLATYGPYGKDVPYESFNAEKYHELGPAHKTVHSSWETPTPEYWTAYGYVVLRADETGTGQSPGKLNPFSAQTTDAFCQVIEWASEQSWSSGKVGLLGISYYAGTQWPVAARNPKGLAAAIPWEGYSDIYRDAYRHGGILANRFLHLWWAFQVASNQYGLPGKAARNWGPDTIEGDLSEEELKENQVYLPDVASQARYNDDAAFKEIAYNLQDIKVPILSVANWGGILLHLRGNVEGFTWAGSEYKYLRFITGRHDLPFYLDEEVEIQRSFLDAFLKGDDRDGWTRKGTIPPVNLVLRKGDIGYNNTLAEKTFPRRFEAEWPPARTEYTKLYLHHGGEMLFTEPQSITGKRSYEALGTGQPSDIVTFTTAPFERETEITGHIVARLNVSVSQKAEAPDPSDLDLFLTLRHISTNGSEILYTGTTGEGAPVTKGWLRVSMRKIHPEHPRHRAWLPYREYAAEDVLPVTPDEVYTVDVELWPTNVVVDVGNRLALDISSGDTAGSGIFGHNDPIDRAESIFKAFNNIHFGPGRVNYITIPIIPSPTTCNRLSSAWQS